MAPRLPLQALVVAEPHRALAAALRPRRCRQCRPGTAQLMRCCCLLLGRPRLGAATAGRGQAPTRPLLASAGRCPAGRALRFLGWLLLRCFLMEEEEGPRAEIREKAGGYVKN